MSDNVIPNFGRRFPYKTIHVSLMLIETKLVPKGEEK
jgi:hypothetical protein